VGTVPEADKVQEQGSGVGPVELPGRITLRHKTGINVYYSNGSAKYVPADKNGGFFAKIKDLPNGLGNFQVYYNDELIRAYRELDKLGG
jgi:hypothetical protein